MMINGITHYSHYQYPLTNRQREILRMAYRGMSQREMADQLGISTHTIKNHITILHDRMEDIIGKRPLSVHMAVYMAKQRGWLA